MLIAGLVIVPKPETICPRQRRAADASYRFSDRSIPANYRR